MNEGARINSGVAKIAYSKKSDGNMSFLWGDKASVIQNRKAFLTWHGSSLEDSVTMGVLNKDRVVIVDEQDQGKGMVEAKKTVRGDALVTKTKKLGLFLFIGDCIPITFLDPINKVLAVAHLGWESTDARLVIKVVETMNEVFGSQPSEMLAEMGPSIHQESYKHTYLRQQGHKNWQAWLQPLPDGQVSIDLPGYNKQQLIDAGVSPKNIRISNVDTATSTEYFSHYRSIRTAEPEGRFAVLSMLI